MDGPVLFSRPSREQEYIAWRDAELQIGNPHFLEALHLDALEPDQRIALYQALEMLDVPMRISQETVDAARADPAPSWREARYINGELAAQLMTPIACMVGGDQSRRDEVRCRLYLALRIIRMVRSQ